MSQKIINEPSLSECVSYLAVKFNLSLICVQPFPTMGIMERIYTRHMSNPTVVANKLASFSVSKTFIQRFNEPRDYDLHAPIPPSLIPPFLLVHLNVKLFISHGGISGLWTAVSPFLDFLYLVISQKILTI
ncbi:hypothetical protein QTP88_012344 [Uroleucon formosanum]